MRISRGRRGNPKRFEKLDRYTEKKKKSTQSAPDKEGVDRIFVSDKDRAEAKPEPIKTQSPQQETPPVSAQPPAKPPQKPPKGKKSKALPPKGKKPWQSFFRYTLLILLLVLMVVAGAGIQVLRLYLRDLPAPEALERYRPMLISRLYSDDGELIGEYVRERRKLVPFKDIPDNLVYGIVAREDKYFFKHFGVDPVGVARAFMTNVKAGRVKQGGSTLTQQLVKNLTNENERAMQRKIKEALLALKVERTYSKDEILEMYLNQVYFGHGCYGIGAAAEYYFNKETKDLTLNECAMLAGLIQRPSTHSPFINPERARIRRISVLRRMAEDGYITEKQMKETAPLPLRLASAPKRNAQKNLTPYFYEYVRLSLDETDSSENGEISNYPMEIPAINAIGHKKLYSDGLNIESTIDLRMQLIAREAIRRGVKNVEKVRRQHPSYWGEPSERIPEKTGLLEGGIYDAHILDRPSPELLEVEIPGLPEMDSPITIPINPAKDWRHHFGVLEKGYWLQVTARRNAAGAWKFFAADESHVQACLVALEVETGKILALIGGYRFFENQPAAKMIFPFQARVQPGSCFKPIVFACAFSRGMTPTDTIDELPLEYQIGDRVWHIENFESTPWNPSLHGETPLRRALIKSMNVASVHLWNRLTNDNHLSTISYFARENMGIQSPIRPERASALGTSELYPIELAAAYAAFANGGRRVHPYAIDRITDHYGNSLARQYPVSEPILQDPRQSSQIAYQITQCLRDVIEEPEGSGYRTIHELYPNGFPFPVAGKTGTTNDCSDAWFTGYNPKIVTCVWVGFERKKSLGVQMTGSRAALPIWAEFMEKAVPLYEEKVEPDPEKRAAMRNFPVPAGMVSVEICKKSGGLANDYCRAAGRSVEAAFIAGTEPKTACEYHGPKDMDAFDEFVDGWIASDGNSSDSAF